MIVERNVPEKPIAQMSFVGLERGVKP